ncbi:hypothetical protein RJ639_034460 [Escallonia herrerae]|uniref:Protein kinase domain-containing protein n=1 Tax=Escallonia herrerae TaxID=1293975 RepID=A0AA89BB82_9ASTE|nr:hypothetical protein RJ639_034460 [Escallonia herrerae]
MSSNVVDPTSQITATTPKSSRKSSKTTANRSPPSDPSTSANHTTTTTGSSYAYNYNKDSWKSSVSSRASLSSLRDSLQENAHVYAFSEIAFAANNFLAKRHHSSSSSASWRCCIRDADVIVFQRKLRRQIDTSELQEKLSLICKSHYSSIIKLKGASMSGSYIYLVYDYIHGANLADCLRNPRNPNFTVLSNWMSRIQIATDLAHGLDYIHNSTGLNMSFVHNHVKSTSIIVTDVNFSAKICHFGTAELCGEMVENDTRSRSRDFKRSNSKLMRVEGTRGYMSPEYQLSGVGTKKSDVYAFGVVVLELLTGEEPLKYVFDGEGGGYFRVSVVETARAAVGSGGVRRWVDKRLRDSYPAEAVEKLVGVALDCVEEDPEKRPDMGRVAGRVSKLYLESRNWVEKMGVPTDFTVSLAPR